MSEFEKPKPQEGLIAFFDILGYQVLLENNSAEKAAEKILKILVGLRENTPSGLQQLFEENLPKPLTLPIKEVLNKINWLIFSDTILLTLETEDDPDPLENAKRWAVFLSLSSFLFRKLFDYGLPLRGVIGKGPFIVQEACFAGKTLVHAYKLASRLNFAGCVITEEALKWSLTLNNAKVFFERFAHYSYAVPEKSGEFHKSEVLNVALFTPPDCSTWEGDIRQIVYESFWKHNKDIKGDVQEKINQTEQYLRFLKMRYPDGFLPKKESK